ncbi:hypothetical protein [Hyphomicrobium sp.]|uniref:hypothetical protein n=1 Tax=Hyphomicrobium sp. TaxID=82 RepID=UPI000FC18B3E|nr:hypothetical protein [Hyphomicrobium sp.]RUO99143.1 MAG: hypothetical protein EKK30_07790 [Hyphomicrobium sp.]
MDRPHLKLILAVAALLAAMATPSVGQQFQYTPYRGFNNTGQPNDPPPDNYSATHPSGVGTGGYDANAASSAPSPSGEARQSSPSDAYSSRRAAAAPDASPPPPQTGGSYSPSGDVYSPPPRGAYSPSEDVYSPSHVGRGAPPPDDTAGGRKYASNLPRVEVQAAAPDDGLPFEVRQHDARRAAIEGWSSKVANRYGPEFSQWGVAAGKHVDCHPDSRDGIVCTASAQPVRGGRGGGPAAPDDYRN